MYCVTHVLIFMKFCFKLFRSNQPELHRDSLFTRLVFSRFGEAHYVLHLRQYFTVELVELCFM